MATTLAAVATLLVAANAPPSSEPRIALEGTLVLPDEAPDEHGASTALTGLSGVAWLGDDRYVAVMDNSDQIVTFRLELSPTGRPLAVNDVRVARLAERHDYEDVAVSPAALTRRIRRRVAAGRDEATGICLLLAEEDTPAIRAAADSGGDLLGVVPIPEIMRQRRPNRGLEAIAVDPEDGSIWTANEEALVPDGPGAGVRQGTVVRLVRIPLPPEQGDPARAEAADGTAQFAYRVEPPHDFVRVFAGQPLAGVTALVALGTGRLLVLERVGVPGLPPFRSRIFLVEPRGGRDVSGIPDDLAGHADAAISKRLLWEDSLGCNLEGLCLGPRLVSGCLALVGVADNGGLGTPNQLVGLSLEQSTPRAGFSTPAAALTMVAACLSISWLATRFTSP